MNEILTPLKKEEEIDNKQQNLTKYLKQETIKNVKETLSVLSETINSIYNAYNLNLPPPSIAGFNLSKEDLLRIENEQLKKENQALKCCIDNIPQYIQDAVAKAIKEITMDELPSDLVDKIKKEIVQILLTLRMPRSLPPLKESGIPIYEESDGDPIDWRNKYYSDYIDRGEICQRDLNHYDPLLLDKLRNKTRRLSNNIYGHIPSYPEFRKIQIPKIVNELFSGDYLEAARCTEIASKAFFKAFSNKL
jgi:hypothetical protein